MPRLKYKKISLYLCFVFTICFLLQQVARFTQYSFLAGDVYLAYYPKALYFVNNLNLSNLPDNEYQPVAILLFIILSIPLFFLRSMHYYMLTFMFFNILLVVAMCYLYKKFNDDRNIYLFFLILLFAGPILFFRFELLVIFCVILSFYLWQRKRYILSTFILGVATLTKVYPILFLPYLLLLTYKNSSLSNALKIFLIYFGTMFSIVICYLIILQISIADTILALNFHIMKSVDILSLWGTLLTGLSWFNSGYIVNITGEYGIIGIDKAQLYLPLWFYNYFWLLPVGLFYLWVFIKFRNKFKLDIRICIALILLLVIFSKVLGPQYLFWFTLMVPLLNFRILTRKLWITNLILVLIAAFLTQYIYPIFFINWINFYRNGGNSYLFWINTLRNLLLVIIFVILILDLKKHPDSAK